MDPLGELCNAISSCKKCDLYFSRKNAVCGFGNANPKLFIVGEAPGSKEDEMGKPFVGRSGKLLDTAVEYAGILKHEIYISNSVRCRPKIGRAPKISEIRKCSGYLSSEILLLKPRIIVPMGNSAIKSVGLILGINLGRISEVQGSILYADGKYLAPQFHPAAILRDPKKLERFKDNFLKVSGFMEDLHVKAPEGLFIDYKIRRI